MKWHNFNQAYIVATPNRGPRCRHRRGASWFLPFHPRLAQQSWVRLKVNLKYPKNVTSVGGFHNSAAYKGLTNRFKLVCVGKTLQIILKKISFYAALKPQRGAAITCLSC